MFGLRVAFLATQSGLTRWMYFDSNKSNDIEPGYESLFSVNLSVFVVVKEDIFRQRFHEVHNHAIDEVWYKRAVEQHSVEQQSFVFSVPFDAGDASDTLVTASHAIFINEDVRSAPAAVVGYQFQHSALYNLFRNITSKVNGSYQTSK